jgi:hypothetical protein
MTEPPAGSRRTAAFDSCERGRRGGGASSRGTALGFSAGRELSLVACPGDLQGARRGAGFAQRGIHARSARGAPAARNRWRHGGFRLPAEAGAFRTRNPRYGPCRDRTCDLGIKSPLLYQLS